MTTKFARGEGRVGCIIWLLVLVAVAVVLWEAVPIKIRTVDFYDHLGDQAKFAQRSTAEAMRKSIMNRAKELEIPLDPKDLTIAKSDQRVRIECSYTVPVELPGYTYDWHFHHLIDEPIFIF